MIVQDSIVRLNGIAISNFKNVIGGNLTFINPYKKYDASVLGLYGQNGSGKTALVEAFQVLKYVLCGKALPSHFIDLVHIDSEYAKLCFEISLLNTAANENYTVFYEFCLGKAKDTVSNLDDNSYENNSYKPVIYDEIIKFSMKSEAANSVKQILIDTTCSEPFQPRTKYNDIVGESEETAKTLVLSKALCRETSTSFIFSSRFLNVMRSNCINEQYKFIIESLVHFGNSGLFVIDTKSTGLNSLVALPISFKYSNNKSESVGSIPVPLDGAVLLPEVIFVLLNNLIDKMNIVLKAIIPGLTLMVNDLGAEAMKDGVTGRKVQLMSMKNGKPIPLTNESEGIRKIVSVLQLLIELYNNSSITVVIDELDSGIFEYLLGELTMIISEEGKGQLIFTSHNLRPLETIDRGFIAFTTTNAQNRYIRMTNIKKNNNLRDFYYRDIMMNEQAEELYDSTDNYEIAYAFRRAGENNG